MLYIIIIIIIMITFIIYIYIYLYFPHISHNSTVQMPLFPCKNWGIQLHGGQDSSPAVDGSLWSGGPLVDGSSCEQMNH